MKVLRFICGAAVLSFWLATAMPARAGVDPSASAAAPETFAILEYRVLGNSVLPTRTIERAVYPYLGRDRSLKDAQDARTELQKAYRDAGYSSVYVDIPEQSVEKGIVRLQVTEGRIERVRVTGMRYFSERRVIAAVPSLGKGTVPYFPAVQQELGQVNARNPDLRVTPVLHPGTQPGTVDVDLRANDGFPLHGSAEVNNRYTVGTTHTRLYFNLGYANLFQSDQSLALQYQMAPERTKDSGVLAATYAAPLGPPGASLALLGVKTDSDIATLGTLGVLGRGHIYGAHYSLPVATAASFSAGITLGGDYKDFDQNVLLSGGGLETPIRYINWSAVLAAAITRPKMTASFDVTFAFGVRGLENRPPEFENNRYLAKPDYSYLRFNTSVDHALIWGSRLALRVSTQYTTEPLLNTEQFAIGGVDSVRGYLEAEELGDLGASGSAELRSATLTKLFGLAVRQANAFLFTDAGIVKTVAPLPQQEARTSLRSWGLGVRFAGLSGLDAALDWAYPLRSSPYVKTGDHRLDFFLRYGF